MYKYNKKKSTLICSLQFNQTFEANFCFLLSKTLLSFNHSCFLDRIPVLVSFFFISSFFLTSSFFFLFCRSLMLFFPNYYTFLDFCFFWYFSYFSLSSFLSTSYSSRFVFPNLLCSAYQMLQDFAFFGQIIKILYPSVLPSLFSSLFFSFWSKLVAFVVILFSLYQMLFFWTYSYFHYLLLYL